MLVSHKSAFHPKTLHLFHNSQNYFLIRTILKVFVKLFYVFVWWNAGEVHFGGGNAKIDQEVAINFHNPDTSHFWRMRNDTNNATKSYPNTNVLFIRFHFTGNCNKFLGPQDQLENLIENNKKNSWRKNSANTL